MELCTLPANGACYDGDYFSQKAAVTVNSYGEGKAYYVGTVCEKRFYHKLVQDILTEAKVKFWADLPEHVEITTRTGSDSCVRFIFNNIDRAQKFVLEGEEISLAPFEMKIQKMDGRKDAYV